MSELAYVHIINGLLCILLTYYNAARELACESETFTGIVLVYPRKSVIHYECFITKLLRIMIEQ